MYLYVTVYVEDNIFLIHPKSKRPLKQNVYIHISSYLTTKLDYFISCRRY